MNTIDNVRFKNFNTLIKKANSNSSFEDSTGIHKTYISHILSGRRNLGTVLCRKIEKKLNLKNSWMDQSH
jgi:hypothetical protein